MIGETISHYRILAKLGQGGMGVVYKAEDTRLGRSVALKFVARQALDDSELKARFLTEARAAAALNHPNICTLYEIDEEHGFLAIELVDGRTVKDLIAERPAPVDEVLDIIAQICAGLKAAHEKGVVHRDIKPGNVMLTGHGQVKIMDFGLAQLADQTRITNTGTAVGTPAYMSPEQAQGKGVDRRTDIWSLGVVLYEMISGRRPFLGETPAAVTYAIVHTQPEPLTALRSGLPVELDRIAAKALCKASGARYQNVDDLAVDLAQLASTRTAVPPVRTSRRAIPWRGASAIAVIAGIAALSFYVGIRWRSPGQPPALRMTVNTPAGSAAADPGRLLGPPVVAPDGSAMVISLENGETQYLFIRRLDSDKLVRLDGTRGATYPFWSPDSKQIAFFAEGKLQKIAAGGGTPAVLCAAEESRGGAWGRTGIILFSVNYRGAFRVSENGGEPVEITKLNTALGENSHRYPVFLPDGNRFLYFSRTRDLDQRGLYLDSIDRKQPRRRIMIADGQFALGLDSRSGQHYLLTQQTGGIVAQRFDISRGEIAGEPRRITDTAGQVSVSDTGLLVLRREQEDISRLAWFDRNGRETGLVTPRGDYWQIEPSPDGARLAVTRHNYLSGYFAVWMANPTQGLLGPFTDESQRSTNPVWAPDGRYLYYYDFARSGIYRKMTDSSAKEEQVEETKSSGARIRDISFDGKYLLAEHLVNATRTSLLWRATGTNEWHLFAGGGGSEQRPRFSADGRWVAYDSNQSGAVEVYVIDFPAMQRRYRVSSGGGREPHWRGDGKEIFYLGSDGNLMSAELPAPGQFGGVQPKPLFRLVVQTSSVGPLFAVSADGQRFVAIAGKEGETSDAMDIILNWPSLLTSK